MLSVFSVCLCCVVCVNVENVCDVVCDVVLIDCIGKCCCYVLSIFVLLYIVMWMCVCVMCCEKDEYGYRCFVLSLLCLWMCFIMILRFESICRVCVWWRFKSGLLNVWWSC